MKQHRQPPVEHLPATRWQWPLDIAAYDRGIELSPEEIDALDCRYNSQSPRLPFKSIPALSRLIRPLEDVVAHIGIRKAQKMGMVPFDDARSSSPPYDILGVDHGGMARDTGPGL